MPYYNTIIIPWLLSAEYDYAQTEGDSLKSVILQTHSTQILYIVDLLMHSYTILFFFSRMYSFQFIWFEVIVYYRWFLLRLNNIDLDS